MTQLLDAALVVALVATLATLGSGRLVLCVRMLAAQGMAMSLLPLVSAEPAWSLAAGTFAIKGLLLPWLLFRAMGQAGVSRESKPGVGFGVSLASGVLMLGASFLLKDHLPVPPFPDPSLVATVALFNLFSGLFLIVTRRLAVFQVMGYLVLENGIYAFGMGFVGSQPFLVELGVLLDLFVAVFVMTLLIYHISRELEHIDVGEMNRLRG